MFFLTTLAGDANDFFEAVVGHIASSVRCFAVASCRFCNYVGFGSLVIWCDDSFPVCHAFYEAVSLHRAPSVNKNYTFDATKRMHIYFICQPDVYLDVKIGRYA